MAFFGVFFCVIGVFLSTFSVFFHNQCPKPPKRDSRPENSRSRSRKSPSPVKSTPAKRKREIESRSRSRSVESRSRSRSRPKSRSRSNERSKLADRFDDTVKIDSQKARKNSLETGQDNFTVMVRSDGKRNAKLSTDVDDRGRSRSASKNSSKMSDGSRSRSRSRSASPKPYNNVRKLGNIQKFLKTGQKT